MGRYYSGDIEGKFWFAVQSSDDGEFFGAEEEENIIKPYYANDLDKAEEGVNQCIEELGDFKGKLDEFFKSNKGYTNKELSDFLEVTDEKLKNLLKWYARLELGIKIRDCIKEIGSCSFEAELYKRKF
jgi:hypothetical protein